MTAPFYTELEHVHNPKCVHSRGETVRRPFSSLRKRNALVTLAGTRHTEGPAWPASKAASRRQ